MSYPAIAQWAGGCLTSRPGKGRRLNPRECHLGLFPTRNRDFGVTNGFGGTSGSRGTSGDIRLWGTSGSRGTSGSEGGARLGTFSHGMRRLNKSLHKGLIWL